MADQDIPNLDENISRLPSDMRADLAELGRRDLYFFCKAMLRMKDLAPKCHMPLTLFIADNPGPFKLILQPRDHLKTSVATIGGNFQKAIRNPNERILIGNESSTNAERMLRAIRQHCEGNKIIRTLYSDVIPKDTRKVRWNDQELDFNRTGVWPEPTFDTIGMTGAVTSRHYSHICIDDPISEEAVKSEKVMKDTIARLSGFLDLLTDPEKDTLWMIGTRWAIYDVYSWLEKVLSGRLTRFIRGAIEDGEPIWPERFSMETLALKRTIQGEYRFSCQQMNNPRNSELQDLNVDDIKFWRWHATERDVIELLARDGQTVEETWPLGRLDITTTVDPAPAEKASSDRNAVVTCGITPTARAIVLDAWGKRCTPLELIEKLFEVKTRFHPRVFGIEGVAYQKVLKYFVKAEGDRRGIYMRIEELKAPGKEKYHVRSIQPIMATGRLYVLPTQMLLRQEMSEFPLGEHDDVVDALGLQSQLWRGQMSPERWEKLQKEQDKMIAAVMRKERTGTDTSPTPRHFDTDDETSDDLPGTNLEKHRIVA